MVKRRVGGGKGRKEGRKGKLGRDGLNNHVPTEHISFKVLLSMREAMHSSLSLSLSQYSVPTWRRRLGCFVPVCSQRSCFFFISVVSIVELPFSLSFLFPNEGRGRTQISDWELLESESKSDHLLNDSFTLETDCSFSLSPTNPTLSSLSNQEGHLLSWLLHFSPGVPSLSPLVTRLPTSFHYPTTGTPLFLRFFHYPFYLLISASFPTRSTLSLLIHSNPRHILLS